jgi:hypothetical protein
VVCRIYDLYPTGAYEATTRLVFPLPLTEASGGTVENDLAAGRIPNLTGPDLGVQELRSNYHDKLRRVVGLRSTGAGMNDPLPGANNALLVNPCRNLATLMLGHPKATATARSYLW